MTINVTITEKETKMKELKELAQNIRRQRSGRQIGKCIASYTKKRKLTLFFYLNQSKMCSHIATHCLFRQLVCCDFDGRNLAVNRIINKNPGGNTRVENLSLTGHVVNAIRVIIQSQRHLIFAAHRIYTPQLSQVVMFPLAWQC